MARDKVTIELEIQAKRAQREIDKIQKQLDKVGKTASTAFGGAGGGDKVRALGTGLSKATVRADEFNKSLEASNARVIAFGASAGLIMQVDRALKAMVTSAIKVEKAMKDVAVVMEVSNRELNKFGKGMFTVAKQTAQSFDTVSEAAVELARQGLGMEKTLARTKDALILTRLTGMNAADSVKSLTAAVNSFNKEGVTSAQIINRMAKVDAAFAVSSEDLAKSISRVGASAVSAGVSMNELMAITTAVQQKTARGGAVIGNAFKTIFTRIQRSSVQKKLKDFGVATTDMSGKMLSGIQVVQNLADKFGTLSKAQQASVSESVAGVFQVNILKAAMSDLASETSNYKRALDTANTATDEAYRRNEQLNQTLDALVNRTLANLTQAGAGLGGGLFEPAIRKVLGTVNVAIESFGKDGKMEGFGQTIGKGLIAGLSNFIAGPGLVMAIAVFSKLSLSLAKFATTALKDIMGINVVSKQRLALEEAVVNLLRTEPMYLDAVEKGTLDILKVERAIFNQIKANNLERSKLAAYAGPVTAALMGRGAAVGKSGTVTVPKGAPGGAGGFIPNFANPGAERAAAAAGGYRAGGIRTMSQPGAGTIMYNSAETVKRFPGMSQSAIMPPQGSPAGAGYRAAFGAAHGFDPYAGGGFVPNFAGKVGYIRKGGAMASAPNIGVALGFQGKKGDVGGRYVQKAGDITALRANLHPDTFTTPIGLTGVKTRAIYRPGKDESDAEALFESEMDKAIRGSLGIVAASIIKQLDKDGKPIGSADRAQVKSDVKTKRLKLSPSFEGDLFEEGLRMAIQGSTPESTKAAFDFEAGQPPTELMKRLFGTMPSNSRIDAKRQQSTADNIVNKYFSEGIVTPGAGAPKFASAEQMLQVLDTGIREGQIVGKPIGNFLKTAFRTRVPGMAKGKAYKAATGFVPNFSPLSSAIGRELQAGVPASAIRVGSSPALRGVGNPGGVGVYNTIHEPGGLKQGISRSRSMGIDPRGHGVPNYAIAKGPRSYLTKGDVKPITAAVDDGLDKPVKGMNAAADKIMMGAMFLNIAASGAASGFGASPRTQAGVSWASNVTTMAAMGGSMGVAGGPVGIAAGALIGGGLGALTSMGDYSMAWGEAGEKADAEATIKLVGDVNTSIVTFTTALQQLKDFGLMPVEEKLAVVNKLQTEHAKILEMLTGPEENLENIRKKFIAEMGVSFLKPGQSVSDFKPGDLSDMIKTMSDWRDLAEASIKTGANVGQQLETIGGRNKGSYTPAEAKEVASTLAKNLMPLGVQSQLANAYNKQKWDPGVGWDNETGDWKKSTPFNMEQFSAIFQGLRTGTGGFRGRKERRLSEWTPEERKEYQDIVEGKITDPLFDSDTAERGVYEAKGSLRARISSRKGAGGWAQTSWEDQGHLMEQLSQFADFLEGAGEVVFSKELQELVGKYNKLGEGSKRRVFRSSAGNQTDLRNRLQGAATTVGEMLDFIPFFASPGDFRPPSPAGGGGPTGPTRETMQGFLAGRGDWYRGQGTRIGLQRARDVKGFARERGGMERGQRQAAAMLTLTDAGTGLISAQKDQLLKTNTSLRLIDERNENNRHQSEMDKIGIKAFEDYYVAIEKAEMSMIEKQNAVERLESDYGLLSEMSMEELKANRKHLLGLEAKSTTEEENLKFLQNYIKQRDAEEKKHQSNLTESSNAYAHEATVIEENAKFLEEQYKEGLNWQKKIQKVKIKELAIRTLSAARGLRELADEINPETGRKYGITRAEIASADKEARRAGIRGGTRGGATFGEIFGEVNAYGKTDYMLEFEDGMTSVAENMKSSFADAFKAISSGSMSASSAIAMVADSILSSISDMSAKMASNILFSKMFPGGAKGGYVPKFQSGGVVTGGSGVRDDVLTMMSGGEYVIRKSAAQKIGYGTLDAINGGAPGYAAGGSTRAIGYRDPHSGVAWRGTENDFGGGTGSMRGRTGGDPGLKQAAGMLALSAATGLAAGYLNRPGETDQIKMRDYGFGRSEHGFLGGADPDAGGRDSIRGGGRGASVSLNKAFVYYRRDPVTGNLVSERARPTEGRFETSSLLSTKGLLREDDPQTARMFGKEKKLSDYQNYLAQEKLNRKNTLDAHNKAMRGKAISSYVNAAMLVGGAYYMGEGPGTKAGGGLGTMFDGAAGGAIPRFAGGGKVSPAMLMGGEYVMSPDAVRTHGVGFMSELNRGNIPGGAGGGFFMGGGGGMLGGGTTNTNNVKININVDKSGRAEVGSNVDSSSVDTGGSSAQDDRDTNNEIEKNKAMGELLQGIVLNEIQKQQRPGGMLAGTSPYTP